MLQIIIILIAIGLICLVINALIGAIAIIGTILPYLIFIALVIGGGVLFYQLFGVIGLIVYIVLCIIAFAIYNYKLRINELNLVEYLNMNCTALGYMTSEMWESKLPQFAKKSYSKKDFFKNTTTNFTNEIESKCTGNNSKFFLYSFKKEFEKNPAMSIAELRVIVRNYLKFTHSTSDDVFYAEAMDFAGTYNDNKLAVYLGNNCTQLGYMNEAKWTQQLSDFANRIYKSSFVSIIDEFASGCENSMLRNSHWIMPYLEYIKDESDSGGNVVEIYRLEKVPNNNLCSTHHTPDAKLIHDSMESYCKKECQMEGFEIISVPYSGEFAIEDTRRALKYPVAYDVPEYYLGAYRMKDSVMESEELSLDDLGIDID